MASASSRSASTARPTPLPSRWANSASLWVRTRVSIPGLSSPGDLEGAPGLIAVRRGRDQQPGPAHPGRGQDARRGRVAVDHPHPVGAQPLHQAPIPLDHHVGQLEGVQRAADRAPHPAEADDDGVVARAAPSLGRCRRQARSPPGRSIRARRPGRPRSQAVSRSTAANTSGLRVIESRAPARIRSWPSSGSNPSARPSPARMNENSPIWARLAETVSAVRAGGRRPARSRTPRATCRAR